MWNFMQWYHIGIFALFMVMVFSPVWFFRKLDRALNGEDLKETILDFNITPRPHLVIQDDYSMDRDDHVLNNFNKMIENAPASTRNMWVIKKAEFERQLRWKSLVNFNHGKDNEKARAVS